MSKEIENIVIVHNRETKSSTMTSLDAKNVILNYYFAVDPPEVQLIIKSDTCFVIVFFYFSILQQDGFTIVQVQK